MTNHLAVDVADGVLRVTFRRPEAFNALSEEMAVGLVAALDRAAVDDDVRVVAVSGSGTGVQRGRGHHR